MKRFAVLLIVCLFTAVPLAHATDVNPLDNGYSLTVGNTVLSNTNATFDSVTGILNFSDGTSTYTFVEANAAPLIDALSITRICVTLNLGGCTSTTISISDASLLDGTLQASALVGVTLQASASAGVSNLVFADTTAAAGAETALVGYPASGSTSVTPEPSSLVLIGTGMLGIYGAARRRFAQP